MIFTDRTVIVQKGTSSINDTIVLYRGDREVEIRFTLNESSPFKFGSGVTPNIIEKTEAAYGQLVIKVPGDKAPIFSEITATKKGAITFTITAEMIDEITEVGNYTFQIRLLDENKEGRVTIPEVVNGIEVREPIATEDISDTNEVGIAAVGYALTTAGTTEDAFDSQGNYNKTTWGTGDRITAAKLNKIEAGIEGVNQKVASGGTSGGVADSVDWSNVQNKPTIPTKTSQLTNDSDFVDSAFVSRKIADASLSGGEVDLSGYVTKETGNASQITFADGQTFQAKLDAGTLKGEKGDPGIQGEQGPQGLQGEQGPAGANGQDGLTTSISLNGVTYTQENGVITLPNITSGGNIPSVAQIEPEALDMPKVFFYGAALPTTKDNVNLTMDYISNTTRFSSFVKLKCQGTSSMGYAKKNFTVAMYSDEERATKLKKDFRGWGAQSKFCLKANYVDTTHTRNISGARIAYDMVNSRPDSPFKRQLSQCPRNGAVDGFPIKLYFNGEFYGIYTWNIPKDAWMFNMKDENPNHMVLCAEQNNNGNDTSDNVLRCEFRKEWDGTDGASWSIEVGTLSDALKNSFNRCVNFVMTATDEEFKANIGDYFDLYSLLDYYCFSYLIAHIDGLGKNMLMATYDGVIWGAALYDMDSIYGADWNGSSFKASNIQCPEQYQETNSLLWQRIESCFSAELYARYSELRQGALSLSNIIKHVEEIYDVMPDRVLADEKAKWTSLPGVNTNTMTRFRNYMRDRAKYVDAQMEEMKAKVPCTGIVLGADTLSFTTTDTQTLEVVVSPSDTTDTIVWSVEPAGIVSIDNGVVSPLSNGSCTITVTCGAQTDTCSVVVSGITSRYSITYNLSNCTSSNNNSDIQGGESYTTTITPIGNNTIRTISVTMAGIDITSTALSGNTITIDSVTGAIIINCTAADLSNTNLLDGMNTERGYLKLEDGSFAASSTNTDITTDFIPFIGDDNTIYKYEFSGGRYLKVCFYNSSKEFLFGTNTGTIPETTDNMKYSSCSFYSHDSIVKGKGVAYIRCSMNQNSVGSAIAKRSIVNNFSELLVPEGECPEGHETVVINETSTLSIVNGFENNPSGVNGNTIFETTLPTSNYGVNCISPRLCIKTDLSGFNSASYAGVYNRMSSISWSNKIYITFTLDSSMVGTTLDEVKAWLTDNPITVYVPTK